MVRREGRPRRAAQARKQGPDRKSLVKYVDYSVIVLTADSYEQQPTRRPYGRPWCTRARACKGAAG